jgi:MFS family permease
MDGSTSPGASEAESVAGRRGEARPKPGWLVLALACLGQFMVVLDISIVNVALPTIRDDLGISASDLQWVVNAYTLALGGFLLLGGRAADLFGRRRMFIAGLAIFIAASLAGGFASSLSALVLSRALKGLGAAVLAPATLTIITTLFPEGRDRARWIRQRPDAVAGRVRGLHTARGRRADATLWEGPVGAAGWPVRVLGGRGDRRLHRVAQQRCVRKTRQSDR